jgi:glutamate synthase (NADPH/NADH) small chain
VELVEHYGVRLAFNSPLSDKLTLDTLSQRGFSAVFLGIGLGEAVSTLAPGSDLDGVVGSLEFLARARRKDFRVPSSVAVIGGGNTAIDAACTAKSAGARDVYLLYRRSFQEMPAWPRERNLALDAGIHVMVLTAPVRYVGDAQGRVCAVECTHMQLAEADAPGRRRPQPLPNSHFTLPVGLVVEAVGQAVSPEVARFLPGVDFTREGHIKVDKDTLMTSRPGVFAGGDLLSGGATVVQAVADGVKAAEAMALWLTGR